MRQRQLGKTGLSVTELGLGTWGLSGDAYGLVPAEEMVRVIARARALGVTLFETSASYADGGAEVALGQALAGAGEVVVVTKLGTNRAKHPTEKCFQPAFLKRAAALSRSRLGQGVRLVALLHNPLKSTLEKGEACAAMKQLTVDGVLDSWGVSAGDEATTEAALAQEAPVISLAYNLLQVQPLRAMSERFREHGTAVLAHSVLAYGLLTGRWAPGRTFPAGDHRSQRWPDGALRQRIRHLDAVRPLVSGDVTSMRSAAVRFALSSDVVSCTILGPRTAAQLDQLVRDAQGDLPYLSSGKMEALEHRMTHLEVPR